MKCASSLCHTMWDCKYHVVWIPKCRRKVLFGKIRGCLGEMFHVLAHSDSLSDAPGPVAGVQDAPVVEAPAQQKIPANQTSSTRDEQRELCRRMRNEGKPGIEIAVALWPDDSTVWTDGQERLDDMALARERNRLEKS